MEQVRKGGSLGRTWKVEVLLYWALKAITIYYLTEQTGTSKRITSHRRNKRHSIKINKISFHFQKPAGFCLFQIMMTVGAFRKWTQKKTDKAYKIRGFLFNFLFQCRMHIVGVLETFWYERLMTFVGHSRSCNEDHRFKLNCVSIWYTTWWWCVEGKKWPAQSWFLIRLFLVVNFIRCKAF